MSRRPATILTRLDDLPLYADDLAIGAAIVGPERACEWKAIAPLLEADGLPKIDKTYGGRYVPNVKRFYEEINPRAPMAPVLNDGAEHPETWTSRGRRRLD